MPLQFRHKMNTENIAIKVCTACKYINAHSVKILSKSEMVEREAFVELTRNDPNAKPCRNIPFRPIFFLATSLAALAYLWSFPGSNPST